MQAEVIPGANLVLGKPADWEDGTCDPLSVRSVNGPYGRCMVSQWRPTEEELELIKGGCPVYLSVWGSVHPPVAVFVVAGSLPVTN